MKFPRFLVTLSIGLVLFGGATAVLADEYGLDATAGAAKLTKNTDVTTIAGNVVGSALSLISVLFFALMLYAGVNWMLARGDEEKARKALDTIIAAVIGMVVVLASYALTSFVFKSVSSPGGVGGNSQIGSNGGDVAPVDGAVDKTAWISEAVNGQYCAKYYTAFSCKPKGECSTDSFIIQQVYQQNGWGIQTANYIANACPGGQDQVCC